MKHSPSDNTRDRLLVQAEYLFAQKGFAAVSVREITAAANTNLAAINYHFGNKMNLYLSVFKERWVPRAQRVREFFKKYLSDKSDPGTADMVRGIVMAFLSGPMTDDERHCHISLLQRELTHPTEAINIVVSEAIRPTLSAIRNAIRSTLPPDVDLERLILSIFSIISMIIYFGFAQPVVSRVMNQDSDPSFQSRIVDHIVSFAMNGLNGLSMEKTL